MILVDQVMDAKGLSCPLPLLKTKMAAEMVAKGRVLKVETTEPASPGDMRAWAKSTGNELLFLGEGSVIFTF